MSCPICAKDTQTRYRPFCSKRCADIDLGKWMRGDYAVTSDDPLDPDELDAAYRAQQSQTTKPH